MFMEHNHEIPTNDCTEEELKEALNNDNIGTSKSANNSIFFS